MRSILFSIFLLARNEAMGGPLSEWVTCFRSLAEVSRGKIYSVSETVNVLPVMKPEHGLFVFSPDVAYFESLESYKYLAPEKGPDARTYYLNLCVPRHAYARDQSPCDQQSIPMILNANSDMPISIFPGMDVKERVLDVEWWRGKSHLKYPAVNIPYKVDVDAQARFAVELERNLFYLDDKWDKLSDEKRSKILDDCEKVRKVGIRKLVRELRAKIKASSQPRHLRQSPLKGTK